MSTCDEMRERVSAALDGELGEEERRHLDRHLEGCAACRDWRETVARADERLRRLWSALDITDAEALRLSAGRDERNTRMPTLSLARIASLAAAAVLLLATVLMLMRRDSGGSNRPAAAGNRPPPVVSIPAGEVFPVVLGPSTRIVVYGPAMLSTSPWPGAGSSAASVDDLTLEMGRIDIERRVAAQPLTIRCPQGDVELAAAVLRLEVTDPPGARCAVRLLSGRAEFRDASGSVALEPGRLFIASGEARRAVLVASVDAPSTPPDEMAVAVATTLRGRVEDPDGLPIHDALVTATCRRPVPPLFWRRETLTDHRGEFEIRFPDRATRCRIDVGPTERTIARRFEVSAAQPNGPTSPLRFQVEAGGRIEGTVRSNAGTPLTDVEVLAASRASIGGLFYLAGGQRTVRSDAHGRFAIEHVGPGVCISAQRPGFAPLSSVNGVVGEGQTLTGIELVMAPSATLQGAVRDDRSRPLEGATVRLLLDHARRTSDGILEEAPPQLATVLTDERGRYRLDAVPAGRRVLVIADEIRHVVSSPVAVNLEAGAVEELDFTLAAGARITGQVLDPVGNPVTGAVISTLSRGPDGWRADGLPRISGAQGRFELAGMAGGPRLLVALGPGWAPTLLPVEVQQGGLLELEQPIVLEAGGEISGVVHGPGGQPVSGAAIAARLRATEGLAADWLEGLAEVLPGAADITTQTDARGVFRFRSLAPGQYEIGPASTSGRPSGSSPVDPSAGDDGTHRRVWTGATPVDLWLDGDTVPIDLEIDLRSRADGEPIERFHYRLLAGDPLVVPSSGVLPDQQGGCRLHLSIPRPFQIELGAAGFAPHRVTIPAGSGARHRLEVGLERGAIVRGRILDGSDRAVPGVHLEFKDGRGQPVAVRAGPDRHAVTSIDTGRAARFELRGVPNGPLVIEARIIDPAGLAARTTTTIELSPGEIREVLLRIDR